MKKQFTRLLSLMLVLVMAFALLPTAALAAPAKTKEVFVNYKDVDENEWVTVPEDIWVTVPQNAESVSAEDIPAPDGYKVVKGGKIKNDQDAGPYVVAKVRKLYDVHFFYYNVDIPNSDFIAEQVQPMTLKQLNKLTKEAVPALEHYTLTEDALTIQEPQDENDYYRVLVMVKPESRTITVSYVNAADDVKGRERVSVPYGTTTLQQELLKRIPADYQLADTNDFTITDETTSVKLLVEPIPAEEHENEPDLGTKTIEVLWYLGAEPVGEPCQVEVPLEEDYVRKEVLRNLAAISGALPEGTEMAYPDADYLIEDGSVRVSVVRITKDVTIDVRYYAVYPFLQNTEILTFTVPVDTDPLTLVVEKSDLKQVLPGYSVYYVSEVREDKDGYYAIAMMSMDLEPDCKPDCKPDPKPDTKPSLNKEDHVAYIQGYEDGTFRPQGKITRAEAVTILYRLMDKADRNYYWDNVSDFKDVPKDAWYTTAVATMDNAGVIVDCKDNFRPNEPITRAELAVMAAQFTGKTYSGAASFSDVSSKYWAAEEIAMVEHMGWINGYPDGTFGPDKTITRAEAVAIINRMCERATKAEDMLRGLVTFPDVHTNDWFYEDVLEASNAHEFVRTNHRVEHQNYCYEEWTYLYK